jgi:hypothetical protein
MKIKVEPLLPTGNYLNVRIGIEKDFPDDANEMESVFQVWDNIIAIHMKRYPHLYNEDGTAKYEMYKGEDEMKGTKVRDISEPKDKIQAFKETLDMCTTVVMLERFKPQVDRIGDDGLTQFYETKLKQLK